MQRIDSHQHFWNYHPANHVWMSDAMNGLKKDYGPADLEPLLNACNLDGCIAVQASQTGAENNFLLQLADESGMIKGIVGWVDLQSEKVMERLAYYKQYKKIRGFRHVLHDEPDIDFMLRPAFLNGIKALKTFDYTYDMLIFPEHLPNTVQLVKQFPEQAFVIDHIAKPNIKNKLVHDWKRGLGEVAAFPNVHCKISGMVTEAAWGNWEEDDFKKYIDAVVALFGTKRIMYGSDWPVCTLSASYSRQYEIVSNYFSTFSQSEQDDFFGRNAMRFYAIE